MRKVCMQDTSMMIMSNGTGGCVTSTHLHGVSALEALEDFLDDLHVAFSKTIRHFGGDGMSVLENIGCVVD